MISRKVWIILIVANLLALAIFYSLINRSELSRFAYYRLGIFSESTEPSLDKLRRLYATLKGTPLDVNSTQYNNISTYINILPKYEPHLYTEPIVVDWYSYGSYDSPLIKANMAQKDLESFSTVMSKAEQDALMDLFRILVFFLGKNGIEFIITDGTLLGSVRHFDRIPWDDDVDISIPKSQQLKLMDVINSQTDFKEIRCKDTGKFVKVYNTSNAKAGDYEWSFPSIDVFFYTDNGTHLNRPFDFDTYILREYVYPLRLRPFGRYWLPAPRNESGVLGALDISNFRKHCIRGTWNHRHERSQESLRVSCDELMNFYPFIQLSSDETLSGITKLESLKLPDKTVYLFYYNDEIPVTITINV